MSQELPARPDLAQLRRRAKELRDAVRAGDAAALNRLASHRVRAGDVSLATAQWVIAKEYGFADWARLKTAIEGRTTDLGALVEEFLTASIAGSIRRAAALLATEPRIARHDIRTAAVLGDVLSVHDLIGADAEAVVRPDSLRGWAPLLYVCRSRWHRVDSAHAEGLYQTASTLLDAGADPNTNNRRRARFGYCSALFGAAGIANNPAIAALLLGHGADPNDDESLYHAACHHDTACLRLLLGFGARPVGTNALAAAVAGGNTEAVRLLLEAGADPGRRPASDIPDGHLADRSEHPLPLAVARCGVDIVESLLVAGADPNARGDDHVSALRTAVRRGSREITTALLTYGADDDATAVDHFLGAAQRGDRDQVRAQLLRRPGLWQELAEVDREVLVDAAENADVAAVALLLELGFPMTVLRVDGATPLHAAASYGRAGADVNAPDGQWGSTALAWATIGSGEQSASKPGDWAGTIRSLIAAGSSTDGAWVGGKPPNEQIAVLLAEYGIDDPGE
jgi:ankyrin repeat protein